LAFAVLFLAFAAGAFGFALDVFAAAGFLAAGAALVVAALTVAAGAVAWFAALGVGASVHCHVPVTSAQAWPSLAAPYASL
jgi:hypothetical protein